MFSWLYADGFQNGIPDHFIFITESFNDALKRQHTSQKSYKKIRPGNARDGLELIMK